MQPHDLIWIPKNALCTDAVDLPLWVKDDTLIVVVRRDLHPEGLIPVGVRGYLKTERFASFAKPNQVLKRVRPYDLAAQEVWSDHPFIDQHPVLVSLAQVADLLNRKGLCWGITGSLGYELATGVSCLRPGSDLDIVIDAPVEMDKQSAQELVKVLEGLACRVDVQLETPLGAIALKEWAGDSQVMIKTNQGPFLTASPWLMTLEATA